MCVKWSTDRNFEAAKEMTEEKAVENDVPGHSTFHGTTKRDNALIQMILQSGPPFTGPPALKWHV